MHYILYLILLAVIFFLFIAYVYKRRESNELYRENLKLKGNISLFPEPKIRGMEFENDIELIEAGR